jgi:hypothetical protein
MWRTMMRPTIHYLALAEFTWPLSFGHKKIHVHEWSEIFHIICYIESGLWCMCNTVVLDGVYDLRCVENADRIIIKCYRKLALNVHSFLQRCYVCTWTAVQRINSIPATTANGLEKKTNNGCTVCTAYVNY